MDMSQTPASALPIAVSEFDVKCVDGSYGLTRQESAEHCEKCGVALPAADHIVMTVELSPNDWRPYAVHSLRPRRTVPGNRPIPGEWQHQEVLCATETEATALVADHKSIGWTTAYYHQPAPERINRAVGLWRRRGYEVEVIDGRLVSISPAPSFGGWPGAPQPRMPLGLAEIATRLGRARATVDGWRSEGLLPTPDGTVGGRPAWWESTIDTWAERTGRTTTAG